MEDRNGPGEVTLLLQDRRGRREEAGAEIIALLYRALERMEGSYLRNERSGHTLEPAGLVSELYLRMLKGATVPYQDRVHFFAVAARQLRRILVDYARKRKGRGEELFFVTLSELEHSAAGMKAEEIEDLEKAMNELEKADERAHRVVELRFFGGPKEDAVAELMGLSRATMKWDWAFAKAFLTYRMGQSK
ncbi:MAG: RNA polymerase subunit sigma-70 [Bryobacter sp.]|jgi:RNA polymerase sigma factor (TIGR02999 family)|nr:RNA polymerase subunit sigma-70 [Bryobacter sp. CoA8 C33]